MFEANTDFRNLASRLHSRDETAYEFVICHAAEPIIRYIITMDFSREDAKDVWSDLVFNLWQTCCRTYDPSKSSLPCWLKALARNLAIDRKRKDRHAYSVALEEAKHLQAAKSVEEKYCGKWDWELAENAIRSLSPDDQEVLELRRQGLTYAEISQISGTSSAVVGMRVTRAIKRARASVERLNTDEEKPEQLQDDESKPPDTS